MLKYLRNHLMITFCSSKMVKRMDLTLMSTKMIRSESLDHSTKISREENKKKPRELPMNDYRL